MTIVECGVLVLDALIVLLVIAAVGALLLGVLLGESRLSDDDIDDVEFPAVRDGQLVTDVVSDRRVR